MNPTRSGEWEELTLGEVADIVTGSTPSTKNNEYFGGEVPFATPSDLDGDWPIEQTSTYLTSMGAAQVRTVPAEAVLVCCIGSLGKVGFAGRELATNQQINSLVFDKSRVAPRYGYHFCRTLKPILEHMAPATTVAIVNKTKFSSLPIRLPPLPEQKRIAEILDKADAIRRKRQEAAFAFDLLSDSLFNQLSHEYDIQPQSVAALLDLQILLVHKDGNFGGSYPRKHEFGIDGIPFLSAKHVAPDGTLSKDDVPRLNEDKARTLPFGWIERGDVLLAHNATVGPVALYSGEYEEALIGTSLTCYRPNPSLLRSEFLFAALRGSHFQRQLTKAMSQTTRNQVPITAQRKLTLHIPLLEQQEYFSGQLSAIRTLRKKYVKTSTEADTLFDSLVQRAFKGEL